MALTTNFGFTLLNGSDTAGFSSINTVIQSIDTTLLNRLNVSKMIMLYDNTALLGAPNGWTNITTALNAAVPNLATVAPYIWIQKT